MQLATDSLGNVWVTFSGLNFIGRSALNTLALWDEFKLPAGTGGPVGLYVREANGFRELWYTRPEGEQRGPGNDALYRCHREHCGDAAPNRQRCAVGNCREQQWQRVGRNVERSRKRQLEYPVLFLHPATAAVMQ